MVASMAHDEKWFRTHVVNSCLAAGGYAEVMASMVKNGIADVYVAKTCAAMWLELKFVDRVPVNGESLALAHPFSGPQVRFLRDVTRHGGLAFGLVGVQLDDGIWVSVHGHDEILAKGQLTLNQLKSAVRRTRFSKETVGPWLYEVMADEERLRRMRTTT